MRKMLSLLITCCLLFGTALADVSTQVNAPERYQDVFYSNDGKTSIQIDAAVSVTNADSVNVYEVKARLFSQEEIERTAAAVFEDRPYHGYDGYRSYPLNLAGGLTCTQYDQHWWTDETADGPLFPDGYAQVSVSMMEVLCRKLSNGMMQRDEIVYDRWNEELEANLNENPLEQPLRYIANAANMKTGQVPAGCTVSLEDAQRQANQIAAQAAPHLRLVLFGVIPRSFYNIPANMDREAVQAMDRTPEAWIFFYAPVYELPYNFHYPFDLRSDYGVTSNEESLAVVIGNEGLQHLYWTTPHEIIGVMEENCSLLSFGEIIDVAKSILPLKYAALGGNTWSTIKIERIQLGYMRVLQIDHPDSLMLVPVWDFYGWYETSAHRYDFPSHSLLTINAIDGTVIDRLYGY